MQRTIRFPGIAALTLALVACGPDASGGPLEASGFIEADEIGIVAETGGRVAEVLADEGDEVEAGQILIRLDDSLFQTHRAEAEAALDAARALRDEQVNGPRPEVLAQAEARLAAAEAELEGARLALGSAEDAVENPREVNAQLASASGQAQAAAQQVELAEAQVDEAQFWLDAVRLEIDVDENEQQLRQLQLDAAEAELEAARAQQSGLNWQAGVLYEMSQEPLSLIAQMHQAEARVTLAEANAQSARAEVDMLREGPTQAERALLDGQVALAEAQLLRVEALLDQLELHASFGGVVTSRAAQVGETAVPNVPLMSVADLENLSLVVYIPEAQIGRVQTGQPVDVRVDAYAGRVFEGTVQIIAREAEFTPRNIQTEEERVNLVFAVQIDIPNPSGMLKPGMPADATIRT